MKANLFIVGMPKAGTSALYYFLKQHPEIFMSEDKEPNYFCTDLIEESDKFHKKQFEEFRYREEESYLKLFDNTDNYKIVGEASTQYLFSKEAAQNIYDFNPDAKIIIIIREPVSFLYSYHSQLLRNVREDIKDFNKAIASESERKKLNKYPPNIRFPSQLYYSTWVNYAEQIERYIKVFHKSQIKILVYEEYKKDNLKYYKEVLNFLGVNNQFIPEFKTVNTNIELRSSHLQSFFIKFTRLVTKNAQKFLPERFAKKVEPLYYKTISLITVKKAERKQIDTDTLKKLKRKYTDQVKGCEQLIGRDLVMTWSYKT